jgi:hypothetical protein
MDPEDIQDDRTLRAFPRVISMWQHCTGKLDEENSKFAGLVRENSFGLVELYSL